MMEKWSIALNFPSVPSFQYSYIPHVDGFVISVEAGKLFVRRAFPTNPWSHVAGFPGFCPVGTS